MNLKLSLIFTPLEYGPFRAQLESLDRDVQIKISDVIQNVLRHRPYSGRPLRGELEGMWRIWVDSEYRIAYIICDHCRKEGFQDKFVCLDCFKRHWYHIKLVYCGPRKGFYENLERVWRQWMRTVRWERFTP